MRQRYGDVNMKLIAKTLNGQGKTPRVTMAALLTAGAIGGWAISGMLPPGAAALEGLSRLDVSRKSDMQSFDEAKPSLVGSYVVSGTDADGRGYAGNGIVDISLAPSGALELEWDNGKQVGIGQVIGNVLAIASLTKGRTAILLMTIHQDGSLSGKWSRRTDRGNKGTEIWKKA
jgi:hypothetical protein